jgi:peptidylprolyl isomerase domain and WD repeat-containing protein 1
MPESESTEPFRRKDAAIPQEAESSDDDIGPSMPTHPSKKQRVLQHEAVYLGNLPDKDMYEKSLMHRDVVNFVCITASDFIITTSTDGHVKFWKKQETGIEFVKHFRAHMVRLLLHSNT